MSSAITGSRSPLGPLVGGAVVEGIDWEWIFWLNVPIGLVAAPLALRKRSESRGPDTGLDFRGLALISGGALGIVWGLVRANEAGWGSARCSPRWSAGGADRRVRRLGAARAEPMLPLRLFRNRGFSAGNAAIFFTFAVAVRLRVPVRAVPADRARLGAARAGLRLMPWTITFILVAPAAGALADRIGERPLMATGLAMQAVGLGLAGADRRRRDRLLGSCSARSSSPGSVSRWRFPRAERGRRRGPLAEVGKAAGANTMMRELGGVFGIAVVVAVFAGAGGYASAAAFSRRLRGRGRGRRRAWRRSAR